MGGDTHKEGEIRHDAVNALFQLCDQDGVEDAFEVVTEALTFFRSMSEVRYEVSALRLLSKIHTLRGNLDEAQSVARDGIVLCRASGDDQGHAKLLMTLIDGMIAEDDAEDMKNAKEVLPLAME